MSQNMNETLLTDSSDRTQVRDEVRNLFAKADRLTLQVQSLDDAGRNDDADRLYGEVLILNAQALRLTSLYL